MAEVKVTKKYYDKHIGLYQEEGTILDDITDERAKELVGAGVAELKGAKKGPKKEATSKKKEAK